MIKRETLKTEQQNKNSLEIDQFKIPKILETINKEDQKILKLTLVILIFH